MTLSEGKKPLSSSKKVGEEWSVWWNKEHSVWHQWTWFEQFLTLTGCVILDKTPHIYMGQTPS